MLLVSSYILVARRQQCHVAKVIVLPGFLIGRVDIAVITVTDVEVGEDRLVNGGTGGSNAEIAGDGGDLVGGGCGGRTTAKGGG